MPLISVKDTLLFTILLFYNVNIDQHYVRVKEYVPDTFFIVVFQKISLLIN